jgi:hypothetical protein
MTPKAQIKEKKKNSGYTGAATQLLRKLREDF